LRLRRTNTTGSGRDNATGFGFYTAAAVLIPSVLPYTFLVIGPVNKKLLDKADSAVESTAGEATGETTNELLDQWAALNLVRVIVSSTVAVLAAWASIGPYEAIVIDGVGLASGANRLG
jgi:hypothetical protein